MPGRFAAVLYDLDGTLIDTMDAHRALWKAFAAEHGVAADAAFIRSLDGRRAADVVRALLGELPEAEVEALVERREARYGEWLEAVTPLPVVKGALALVRRLAEAGVPQALATSAVAPTAHAAIARMGLEGCFQAVVTAEDVRRGKPHPDVYLEAARRLGVEASRCLVAEDAAPGVQAGRAAGAVVWGLSTSQAPEALLAAGALRVFPDFDAWPLAGLIE